MTRQQDYATRQVAAEIVRERAAQDEKWGEQNHPLGTGGKFYAQNAEWARAVCDAKMKRGAVTWADILREEYYEMLAEDDPVRVREEAVQLAAVATAIVEYIDRTEEARAASKADYEAGLIGGIRSEERASGLANEGADLG
jgi:hypothetical protein